MIPPRRFLGLFFLLLASCRPPEAPAPASPPNDDRAALVSELELAQRHLGKAREQIRALAESLAEGGGTAAVSVTTKGRVIRVSPALAERLGYGPGDLVDRPYTEMIARDVDSEVEEQRDRQLLLRGFSDPYEVALKDHEGREIRVVARAWLIRDSQGAPAFTLAVFREAPAP